jgi:hypothetical protein
MSKLVPNPKPTTGRKAQSGQAIVLIAAIMVGLIGALGLAIDGGGLLFLYRDLQNATDAAIVAATYARCTNGDVLNAGYTAAANSGFNNDQVNNWVEVRNPPTIGPYAGTDDSYVSVTIRATKPSYFIQLVYPGPLEVTGASVGHCRPPFSPANVGALFGISRTCQNTVDWTGSYSVVKGGVFSNNEIHVGGSGGGLTVENPIEAVGIIQDPGGWMTGEVTGVQPRTDPLASTFRLMDFAPGGRYTNVPLYKSIQSMADDPDFKSNGTWDPANGRVLEGLYYINGDVSIGNGVNFGPSGITIVATGQISFSGVDYAIEYYTQGFLLYSGYDAGGSCGQNAITVSGSDIGDEIDTCADILANDYWYGVIYAPKGGVNFSSSDMRMVGAVVADTINRSGADFCLEYDPTVLPPIPPQVEIAQ